MQVKDVLFQLFGEYPKTYQETWDNNGLILGNSENAVNAILIALDCTEKVVDEAIKEKCNLIITHHPVILKGISKITEQTEQERVVSKAIKHEISVIAMHTSADNALNGINGYLADLLGLQNKRILRPYADGYRKLITFCPSNKADDVRKALFEAGAGRIGNYDSCSYNVEGFGTFRALENANPYVGNIGQLHKETEEKIETIYPIHIEKTLIKALLQSHPYEEVAYDIIPLKNEHRDFGSGIIGVLNKKISFDEFANLLCKQFKIQSFRHSASTNKIIEKIAICTGSGAFLYADALQQAADVFITGDVKYHDFANATEQTIIIDIGHFESEIFIKDMFYQFLVKKFPNFAILLSKTEQKPIFTYKLL